MTATELSAQEFHPYYKNYIDQVPNLNLIDGLNSGLNTTISFLKSIPKDKLEYRYAKDKWTVKEIIQHVIDTEIVFAYRALRFARNDATALPGYDENAFAQNSSANTHSLEELLDLYISVRKATINLFKSFDSEMLTRIGKASDSDMSVRALGFVIIGHEIHHCKIINERY